MVVTKILVEKCTLCSRSRTVDIPASSHDEIHQVHTCETTCSNCKNSANIFVTTKFKVLYTGDGTYGKSSCFIKYEVTEKCVFCSNSRTNIFNDYNHPTDQIQNVIYYPGNLDTSWTNKDYLITQWLIDPKFNSLSYFESAIDGLTVHLLAEDSSPNSHIVLQQCNVCLSALQSWNQSHSEDSGQQVTGYSGLFFWTKQNCTYSNFNAASCGDMIACDLCGVETQKQHILKISDSISSHWGNVKIEICEREGCSYYRELYVPGGGSSVILGELIDMICQVAFWIGVIMLTVGCAMFILAMQEGHPDSLARASFLAVRGAILIGIELLLSESGLII